VVTHLNAGRVAIGAATLRRSGDARPRLIVRDSMAIPGVKVGEEGAVRFGGDGKVVGRKRFNSSAPRPAFGIRFRQAKSHTSTTRLRGQVVITHVEGKPSALQA
jgi:hypothetical protein